MSFFFPGWGGGQALVCGLRPFLFLCFFGVGVWQAVVGCEGKSWESHFESVTLFGGWLGGGLVDLSNSHYHHSQVTAFAILCSSAKQI